MWELFLIITSIVLLLGCVVSAAISLISFYTIFRRNWTKMFFSYSHKDAKIARHIVTTLKKYNFRIWVDFGVTISANELRNELRKLMKSRAMCLVLASENSADSEWVQFEIDEAQRIQQHSRLHFWAPEVFRDIVILGVDDAGFELAEHIVKANDQKKRDFWNSKFGWFRLMDQKTSSERAKVEAALQRGRRLLDVLPAFRRRFTLDVRAFDLRGPIEPVMREIEAHLKDNATFGFQSRRGVAMFTKGLLICISLFTVLWIMCAAFFLIVIANNN
jgi:hypothetical protein